MHLFFGADNGFLLDFTPNSIAATASDGDIYLAIGDPTSVIKNVSTGAVFIVHYNSFSSSDANLMDAINSNNLKAFLLVGNENSRFGESVDIKIQDGEVKTIIGMPQFYEDAVPQVCILNLLPSKNVTNVEEISGDLGQCISGLPGSKFGQVVALGRSADKNVALYSEPLGGIAAQGILHVASGTSDIQMFGEVGSMMGDPFIIGTLENKDAIAVGGESSSTIWVLYNVTC